MADPASTRKRYRGEAVGVSFDPVRCRHAAECLRGLPAVFDRDRRPWILPDAGDPADVVRAGRAVRRRAANAPDQLGERR
jgi:uncharacterized Fe-S cluster protein YjdI